MKANMDNTRSVLRDIWGYDDFRPGQDEIIGAIMEGSDVLAVMPTGGGKSICYQVPALAAEGLAIVVSPLISLMHDQVAKLARLGVAAAYIDSTLEKDEAASRLAHAAVGAYKLLYLSPERLLSDLLLDAAPLLNVSILAIDEAHCVSAWGEDFRPEYAQIPRFVDALQQRPVIAAFTATASGSTRDDIAEKLALCDPEVIVTGFARPNLRLAAENVEKADERDKRAIAFVKEHAGQSGIVYCLTRSAVDGFARKLKDAGIDCWPYHAGKRAAYREAVQEKFLSGECKVIVATSAFGMGIDKPDIRFVLSVGMRDTLEDYYQNIGRAGRDGKPADCLLLWSSDDVSLWKWLFRKSASDVGLEDAEKDAMIAKREGELARMRTFCWTDGCRQEFILQHFGERGHSGCGTCDNCSGRKPTKAKGKPGRARDAAKPDRDEPVRKTKSGRVRKSYRERQMFRD